MLDFIKSGRCPLFSLPVPLFERGLCPRKLVGGGSEGGSAPLRVFQMETHEQLLEVETLISPVLSDHGLTLVDLEWRREGRRWVLRLFVDKKEKGEEPKEGREMEPGEPKAGKERVTIADCQRVSLEIGDVLDASGFIRESYDLEVSSPGLDRELKKEREFRWATGKTVRCWVSRSVDGRTEFTGHLKGFTADVIRLEEPGGHLRELPRSLVTRARLELDFSRPR